MKQDEHWSEAVVETVEDLSPTVRAFRLRPAEPLPAFTVGAHLRVQVDVNGRPEVRHYSLVGAPQGMRAEGAFRIAVKRDDKGRGGSLAMWRLQPGDRLPIAGPDNHFELPWHAPHTLLVAGGIGITPILGMALALAQRKASLRLCYAARSEVELVYAPLLREALGERLATFVGRTLDLDAEIAALPARAQLLICGPVPLLQAAQEAWARAGRAAADLRFETFGSSGHLPPEAFRVTLPRHGVDVVVPADRSLLDVLEENGVQVLSDCRRGECGLCAIDVVQVQGRIDHRDVFFSAAEHAEGKRLCACVSRVCGGGIELDSAYRPDGMHAEAA